MFTGIVTDIGTVRSLEQRGDRRIEIATGLDLGGIAIGASIACAGCCLTVVAKGPGSFFVEASAETLSKTIAKFIAPKGSVALDGTSLTVNEVGGIEFGVNIIAHTLAVTTWGEAKAGGRVNVEIDMLARYVARLAEFGTS
ncbi:MAG: riboflavin synthase [Rhizobiales bacterium]|nr:riboflavin synthase [Hyphomicrobiales bacterium]